MVLSMVLLNIQMQQEIDVWYSQVEISRVGLQVVPMEREQMVAEWQVHLISMWEEKRM